MTPDEIDNLLHYVPILIRAPDLSDWEREFCISLAARMKRSAFSPSEKQTAILCRMVAAFQASMADDTPIIERGL